MSKKKKLDKKSILFNQFYMLFIIFLTLVSLLEQKVVLYKTLQADFLQMTVTTQGTYTEKGTFFYKKGVGFRWDYIDPEKKVFWLLKERVVEYYVEDKQARIYRVEENFWKVFEVPRQLVRHAKRIQEEETPKHWVLKMTTKDERKVIIYFNKKTLLPEEIVVDSDNKFLFFNWKINPSLDSALFRPELPEDIEIIN